jgi:hypothetical protein
MDAKAWSGRFVSALAIFALGACASSGAADAGAPPAWLEERLSRLEAAPYPDIRKTPATPRDFTAADVWVSRRDALEADRIRLMTGLEETAAPSPAMDAWAEAETARLEADPRARPAPAWTQDPDAWAQRARAAVAPPPLP